jgi:hypothetical protein
MTREARPRTLKDQNRWPLWLVIAANTLFLYGVIQSNAIELSGIKGVFTDARNLLSVGFGVLIATVLNGFLSADAKARIVFLRWENVLPGHRAFSVYARRDSRIDLGALADAYGRLPTDPTQQNRLWYRIFKTVDDQPHIAQLHRDFLLLRDYTAIALLCLAIYGALALFLIPSGHVCMFYMALLVVQLIVVRQSAFQYGIRLVTNTVATAGLPPPVTPPNAAA